MSYRISEQKTRYSLIDPQLKKAGCLSAEVLFTMVENLSDRTQVSFEISVTGYDTTYETVACKAFDEFILEHNYDADQSRFLRAVQTVFLQRRKLELADLYEEPFTNFGVNAIEKLFGESEIADLLELTKGFMI
ncbi:MAG: type I restriction-modification enzyme R subunit C-terminal domain-containing protein [Bacteroidota bacterium]|nr:type I restriction-modification enzyme R subunit C-terminal domain-containing protein [Bacteroidota bacterium]